MIRRVRLLISGIAAATLACAAVAMTSVSPAHAMTPATVGAAIAQAPPHTPAPRRAHTPVRQPLRCPRPHRSSRRASHGNGFGPRYHGPPAALPSLVATAAGLMAGAWRMRTRSFRATRRHLRAHAGRGPPPAPDPALPHHPSELRASTRARAWPALRAPFPARAALLHPLARPPPAAFPGRSLHASLRRSRRRPAPGR